MHIIIIRFCKNNHYLQLMIVNVITIAGDHILIMKINKSDYYSACYERISRFIGQYDWMY